MTATKGMLVSVGSAALVLLASQHHLIHMLLLTAGTGVGSMTLLTVYPVLRRTMLVLALVMTAVTLYRSWQPQRPQAARWVSSVSAVVTLGLLGWSVSQSGL
ncbi:MAG: hypothetical protein HY329_01320 [Chloroflexi bacterium]|nr:hypothetical protein [Chloroflexota bacterium]